MRLWWTLWPRYLIKRETFDLEPREICEHALSYIRARRRYRGLKVWIEKADEPALIRVALRPIVSFLAKSYLDLEIRTHPESGASEVSMVYRSTANTSVEASILFALYMVAVLVLVELGHGLAVLPLTGLFLSFLITLSTLIDLGVPGLVRDLADDLRRLERRKKGGALLREAVEELLEEIRRKSVLPPEMKALRPCPFLSVSPDFPDIYLCRVSEITYVPVSTLAREEARERCVLDRWPECENYRRAIDVLEEEVLKAGGRKAIRA